MFEMDTFAQIILGSCPRMCGFLGGKVLFLDEIIPMESGEPPCELGDGSPSSLGEGETKAAC